MFSRIVPENSKPSCGTMPSCERSERSVTSRIGDALSPLGERVRLETVVVEEGKLAANQSPASLSLRKTTGATVIAVVRKGAVTYSPEPTTTFEVGDEVLLVGDSNSLEKARSYFER